MNKKFVIVFISIVFLGLSVYTLCAQTDTLNKVNSKGKKQGYWIKYLDGNFNLTKSDDAIYIGFDLYDNGQNLTRIIISKEKKNKKSADSLMQTTINYRTKKYKLLNGKLSFYDKDNMLVQEKIFSNGHPVRFYAYSPKDKTDSKCTGSLQEIADFTKKYNNQVGSLYYEFLRCPKGDSRRFWFRKGKKKYSSFIINE